MNQEKKEVRNHLKKCPRKEYEYLIYEGKLTPLETTVLQYCILEGKTNDEVGEILKCSTRTVSKIANRAYEKIKQTQK